MTINQHLNRLAGLAVREPVGGQAFEAGIAYRIETQFDELPFDEVFAETMSQPGTERIEALVIGYYHNDVLAGGDDGADRQLYRLLAEAAPKLPSLKHLFLADVVMEESEISWIVHREIDVLAHFPKLETLGIRGGGDSYNGSTRIVPCQSSTLTSLTVEAGGLAAELVGDVANGSLPNLQHLELWLGTDQYGCTTEPEHVAELLAALPETVRSLGLANYDRAPELVAVLASSGVMARLERLDLSKGVLTDDDVEPLIALAAQGVNLRTLDLSENGFNEEGVARLTAAGAPVVGHGQRHDHLDYDGDLYVAVGE